MRSRLPAVFFGLLFYLCSADQFFTTRAQGFNIRLGQVLLLVCAVLSARRLTRSSLRAAAAWLPFFLVYALAATLSDSPARSLLKLGWLSFNLASAFLVCSNDRWAVPLRTGIVGGILAIALTIWVQTIAVYGFGATTRETTWRSASQPVVAAGISPLGFAQNTEESFHGLPILRPNAFYFEPSYAGCALAFAFPLVLALSSGGARLRPSLAPPLVATAVVLTSSRSGILGLGVASALLIGLALVAGNRDLLGRIVRAIGVAVLVMTVALVVSRPLRAYAGYLAGPLGPPGVASRLGDPELSEGGRIANMKNNLRLWARRPLLGHGVTPSLNKNGQGLGQVSPNMWLEVGIESGVLGFLAFGFGFFRSIGECVKRHRGSTTTSLVLCALAAQFLVSMNFTATLPRLDYWLLFFFAVFVVVPAGVSAATRRATVGRP